ncbi:MAG: FtsX-like permease family protein [Bacilli bacterium]|nr:FtsX-like permease family protein [Bacilli bacterium]
MTYVNSYILNSKKRNVFSIIGIILSSILLISVGILFSSLREYLINEVKSEIGDYHVIINGEVNDYDFILNKKYKNKRYYVTYKNIYKVYENTSKICDGKCTSITYNESLLSLYGLSQNKNILSTFKKILYFLAFVLSIIIFFIIYNSFEANLNNRNKDIVLFKFAGMNNNELYKLFFKEALIIGFCGLIIGFIFSLFINCIFLKIINNLLYEIFRGKLFLKIYFPFIFIPFLFMLLIILFSSFLPLRNIKKYNVMALFRKKDDINNVSVKITGNFVLWLTKINYLRSKNKYKSIILSVFILIFSINIFTLTLKYGLECINKFVIMPEYDLKISLNGDSKYLNKISNDLDSKQKIIFRSCDMDVNISKKNFINDYKKNISTTITDIGGNNIINKVNKVSLVNNRLTHLNYNRFKNLKEINFDDIKISNLSLTNKIPFGFKDSNNLVINLDEINFNKVCPEYINNLYLKTDYRGIDSYLDKIIKKNKLDIVYINVKKAKEITNNLVLIIEIFLYSILLFIFLVMISAVINTISINISYRSRELASFQSFGLESKKIIFSLFLESLIIGFKGWFYSIPFIFIINKYLYTGIKKIFDFNKIILNLDTLFFSLILSVITIFVVMMISYKFLNKNSLIYNIKNEI